MIFVFRLRILHLIDAPVYRGVIGPSRIFGQGAMYYYAVYAAVAGVFLPIPFWLLGKKYPKSIFPLVNMAVILNGSLNIPPATGINYASWLTVGFIFRESRAARPRYTLD